MGLQGVVVCLAHRISDGFDSHIFHLGVTQLGEYLPYKQKAVGSIPITQTKIIGNQALSIISNRIIEYVV